MSRVKVDHAVMEHAHAQMNQISRAIDEKLDTLRSGLQRIDWQGTDQQAYQAHQAAWDAAVKDINAILNEIGNAVGIARENYVTTEMSNSKLWE